MVVEFPLDLVCVDARVLREANAGDELGALNGTRGSAFIFQHFVEREPRVEFNELQWLYEHIIESMTEAKQDVVRSQLPKYPRVCGKTQKEA